MDKSKIGRKRPRKGVKRTNFQTISVQALSCAPFRGVIDTRQGWVIVPMAEQHRPWVMHSFRGSMQDSGTPDPDNYLPYELDRELRRPGAACLVAHIAGDADKFLGWMAAIPAERLILFAYTKPIFRRIYGIASTLAISMGIDPLDGPVGVRHWTYACQRLVLRRSPWVLYHALPGFHP